MPPWRCGAGGLLGYFERMGSDEGAELCRRWLDLQGRSAVSQGDIDAFLARLERAREPGSGWMDLGMQFRHWARTRGFEA